MDFEIHSFPVIVPSSISRKQPELGRNGGVVRAERKLPFYPIKREKDMKEIFTEILSKKKTDVKSEGRSVS